MYSRPRRGKVKSFTKNTLLSRRLVFETLEDRRLLALVAGFELTTTGSDALAYVQGWPVEPGNVQLQTAQSGPLINLAAFRADPRFTGIDGSGFSSVIIDSGIDLNHPFFGPDSDSNGIADRIVHQFDFSGANDPDASDGFGHGSNVASIIASQDSTNRGMAPATNIIALKTQDDNGNGNFGDMEEALQWVVANAATFNIASVNMSLGDSGNYNSAVSLYGIGDELAALAAQNVTVVSAAGNSYFQYQSQGVGYPAADPNSLAVSAVWDGNNGGAWNWVDGAIDFTTGADRLTSFSQRSTTMTDIFAPGAFITGANHIGGIIAYAGTSQAAPHIAGIATLAQQLAEQEWGRRLSVAEFKSILSSTGVTIFDGDDEDDNVTNTNQNYRRVDVLAIGEAIWEIGNTGPEIVVDTLTDEFDYDFAAGDLSLREAIYLANFSPDHQTITFASALFANGPAVLALQGQLQSISESLTINGPSASLLTIQAYDPTPDSNNGDGGRVFTIQDAHFENGIYIDVEIRRLTLTGGDPGGSGGAIGNSENLTIVDSVITGNFTGGHGGAIYHPSGTLNVIRSTISGNVSGSASFSGNGGAIWNSQGNVTITDSTITENTAFGNGGGLHNDGTATIANSSFIHNFAGASGNGGGLNNYGTATITNSSFISNVAGNIGGGIANGGNSGVAGNLTLTGSMLSSNIASRGAGISVGNVDQSKSTTIVNSTISSNHANSVIGPGGLPGGGAMYVAIGKVMIQHCTITSNSSAVNGGSGVVASQNNLTRVEVRSSIIAGNVHGDVASLINFGATSYVSLGFNLIGNGVEVDVEAFSPLEGDIIGVSPMVGPLADNGGPTYTHALLPGSPAIDASYPPFGTRPNDLPVYDQRGYPFIREVDAAMDIGAFEFQSMPSAFFGDYMGNGVADAADYVVWRKSLGSSVPNYSGADGSGDGMVGPEDHGVWTAHFGVTLGAGAGESRVEGQESRVGAEEFSATADELLADFPLRRVDFLRIGERRESLTSPRRVPSDLALSHGEREFQEDALVAWVVPQARGEQRQLADVMKWWNQSHDESPAALDEALEAAFEELLQFAHASPGRSW